MFYLSTEQPKMHETALPMVIMFHTSLVIHGRSKLSCFGADKRQVLPRWKWNFDWSNKFREKHKTQCENNIFHHNAKKKVCGREDEKDVMFISSMVLQWIMTFCTYQQKLKTCMKPQFQWEKCCTHVWPSMEDVNLSFFCADKLRVYPRRHWYFHWWNTLKERQKTL